MADAPTVSGAVGGKEKKESADEEIERMLAQLKA